MICGGQSVGSYRTVLSYCAVCFVRDCGSNYLVFGSKHAACFHMVLFVVTESVSDYLVYYAL